MFPSRQSDTNPPHLRNRFSVPEPTLFSFVLRAFSYFERAAKANSLLIRLFSIDLRSLALFRICLGLLLVTDLVSRAKDLMLYYTDDGVTPVSVLGEIWAGGPFWSIHALSGSVLFQSSLFAVAVALSIFVVIGFYSRFSLLASWVLLISLQNRNPLILHGGDVYLRLLLFWGLFLPVGEFFSVDSFKKGKRTESAVSVCSMASAAMMLQIALVYGVNGILKSDPLWHKDGRALELALQLKEFATPFGSQMLAYPNFLKFLTHVTVILERFGPILLFCPVFTPFIRVGLVVSFLIFHLLGTATFFYLGIFPFVSAAALVIFVPSNAWRMLGKRHRDEAGAQSEFAPILKCGKLLNIVCGFFLSWVVLYNVRTIFPVVSKVTYGLERAGWALRLDQRWNMFAPYPLLSDSWIVVERVGKTGQAIDIANGSNPVSWNRLPDGYFAKHNVRSQKYLANMGDGEFGPLVMTAYVDFLRKSVLGDSEDFKEIDIYRLRLSHWHNPSNKVDRKLLFKVVNKPRWTTAAKR